NHGASPWADTMDYAEMAEDVRAALRARGHSRFQLLGHSMGGKAAMMAALLHGGDVERLVVVDIAPTAYPPHHLDYVRAMRAGDPAARRFSGDLGRHRLSRPDAVRIRRAFRLPAPRA